MIKVPFLSHTGFFLSYLLLRVRIISSGPVIIPTEADKDLEE
jgi:hypothetical protein